MLRNMIFKLAGVVFALLLLGACGGGGGGGDAPPPTYTVGGTVSGLDGTVVLQNNGGDELSISANGPFTFATALADGSNYGVTVAIQPTNPNQTCTINNGSGGINGANVTNVQVACVTNTYTIGGTVSGLDGTVVLQNNGGDDLNLTTNSSFTFSTPVAADATYDVTVLAQPSSQTCTVTNGSGRITANVTNVAVTCVPPIYRMSVDSSGFEGNGYSINPAISGDGRYVAFHSSSTDLVAIDNNGPVADIFVRDQQTKETTLVSVSTDGVQGNSGSNEPAISADGRYVAFHSSSSNLVANDNNGAYDIFVHDRQTGTTTRGSVDSDGNEGNASSFDVDISADGRYVVFHSDATNLVAGDTNGVTDIFLHDTQTGTTTRVSLDSAGTQANGTSYSPAISADGRYVAFYSDATDLLLFTADLNGVRDVFVRDTHNGMTTRVSVNSRGEEANGSSIYPALSADGRYVAFYSQASNLGVPLQNNEGHIYLHDRDTGDTRRVSLSSHGIRGIVPLYNAPSITADGRYVTYSSDATNLVDGDNNDSRDVFVHDSWSGTTTRLSMNAEGGEGNAASGSPVISADGRYVAFQSEATNLVSGDTNGERDVFRARVPIVADPDPIGLVSADSNGIQGDSGSEGISSSTDGRYVVFRSPATNLVAGDTNGNVDVFLRDMDTGTTTRVSVTSDGDEVNGDSSGPAISGNGRYVAFNSSASNLVTNDLNSAIDVFVHDRQTGTTIRVSVDSSGTEANGGGSRPAISADGRYVAFLSNADNLVLGDNNGFLDVFLHDTQTGVTSRVSVSTASAEANFSSSDLAISADGRFVVFESGASNLVSNDTNGVNDVFVRNTDTGTTSRVSVDSSGVQGNAHSYDPALSADGRYIGFVSEADNLVANDTNDYADIFVHDIQTGTTSRISVATDNSEGDYDSDTRPAFSVNGRYVAFSSGAENLVANDTNGAGDIFLRDLQLGTTTRVSVAANGAQGNDFSDGPAISGDGRYVLFYSSSTNLSPAADNGVNQIFRAPRR